MLLKQWTSVVMEFLALIQIIITSILLLMSMLTFSTLGLIMFYLSATIYCDNGSESTIYSGKNGYVIYI
jgi:hypothetical protein